MSPVIIQAKYRPEIQDAQCRVWSWAWQLGCLRKGSWDWRRYFAGAVSKSGTEDEMQALAVAACEADLAEAREELAEVEKQAREAA